MPVIESTYHPKFPFTNTHFNTVFRTFFTFNTVNYIRERLELKDGDFMDLDFSKVASKTIAIVLHGLEGSSKSKYILSLTGQLNKNQIDVAAVNFRGCSGELNRIFPSYHSGKTEDLTEVVNHISSNYNYERIVLIGYSLGGNMTLKYLGERSKFILKKISCAIAISPPCDLAASSAELAKSSNYIYMRRFLRTLKSKTLKKMDAYPASFLNKETIKKAMNFYDYDTLFTAPAHGFASAEDYWEKSSSNRFLDNIKIPTLIISSFDDTFLSDSCIPIAIAKEHTFLSLEATQYGGHVGYNQFMFGKKGFWLEKRIANFIKVNSKLKK